MGLIRIGPRYGWVVVAGLSLLLAAMHGLITSGMSVFDKSILTELEIGRGALKFREFLQLGAGGVFSIIIGFAAAKTGPRAIIYAGLALLAVVMTLYSHARSVGEIYALHVALAFCYTSCHVVVVLLILTRWFATRRSIALGIILAGESLGGTVFPQIVVRLNDAFGWRESMQVLAFMPLLLAGLMLLVLRRAPEDHGMPRVGESGSTEAEPGPRAADDRQQRTFRQALVDPSTLLLLGTAALIFYSGSTFINHGYLAFLDRGFSPHRAATGLSLLFIAAFVGKFSSGFFSERFGLNRSWLAAQLILVAGGILFATALNGLFAVAVLLLGFGWGASYTLTQSRVMEQFAGPWLGRLSGIAVFVEGSVSGLGTWQTGALYDRTGSYALPFLVMNIALVAAVLASLALVTRHARRMAAAR
jgi:sugar phosphate permease